MGLTAPRFAPGRNAKFIVGELASCSPRLREESPDSRTFIRQLAPPFLRSGYNGIPQSGGRVKGRASYFANAFSCVHLQGETLSCG
jgi:hypothetical protein